MATKEKSKTQYDKETLRHMKVADLRRVAREYGIDTGAAIVGMDKVQLVDNLMRRLSHEKASDNEQIGILMDSFVKLLVRRIRQELKREE